MADVVKFRKRDAASDPDVVLEEAIGAYSSVVVIGWDKDGFLDARASLNLDHKELHWLISVFQNKLLNGDYADDLGEQ